VVSIPTTAAGSAGWTRTARLIFTRDCNVVIALGGPIRPRRPSRRRRSGCARSPGTRRAGTSFPHRDNVTAVQPNNRPSRPATQTHRRPPSRPDLDAGAQPRFDSEGAVASVAAVTPTPQPRSVCCVNRRSPIRGESKSRYSHPRLRRRPLHPDL
jgi:hypothetical protein